VFKIVRVIDYKTTVFQEETSLNNNDDIVFNVYEDDVLVRQTSIAHDDLDEISAVNMAWEMNDYGLLM
jgi:hypothetical protein